MRERLDPLIAERAPWLFSGEAWSDAARYVLHRMLCYDRCVAIGTGYLTRASDDIMQDLEAMVARRVEVSGLHHIPRHGPALIVANHPTGIADGIVLNSVLRPLRSDAFYYANSDILRVLPQLDSLIAPVEWRPEKRSHAKTRETMAYTRTAMEAGRIGVIFPSGRLAKRRGLSLHERPWMASAAMIARKFGVPIIPLNIRARNSVLFYLFDLIHPTLRDITLFYETLNKDRQPFRITVGAPIVPSALPQRSEEAIEALRRVTLALPSREAPTVSLIDASRQVHWVRRTVFG